MIINLPEHIDLSQPGKYILAIGIREEGYSFSLYNPVQDGSFYYHSLKKPGASDAFEDFKEAYFDNDFFSLPFRKVILMNYSTEVIFLPALLYQHQFKKIVMDSIAGADSDRHILEQEIKHLDLVILHQIPLDAYGFFERSYINARFIHYTSSLISYYLERSRLTKAKQMLLNVREETIDIFCFHQGKYLFGNQFVYENNDDISYHFLSVWKEQKFSQLRDFLYVSGLHTQAVMKDAKRYVHNVIPAQIIPEKHFEGVDTKKIPLEFCTLTLSEV